ncbi:immunoglobulin alpha-2 heavy chain-like isoform X1 [Oncorhynchus keta]|uniref:immunoglobulin alpha-2 heavy chain-like isoform X1 n=1 Tax=Oncorhynchus keta TaxID=8018 RepID=UPI0015FE5470|nr:immunoglobulin alpha-2 heavy chain-like isoform X1 [Oncorhynchus keta]
MCRNACDFVPCCLFALTVCAFTKPNVIQPTPVMVTELGGSVTFTCLCPNVSVTRFNWFKQSFGQKPLLMASSLYAGQDNYYSNNFIKDFTETERLSVRRGLYTCNLTISKTEPGDSATYYCSTAAIYEQTFGEGTVLIVKNSESNSMSVLQQPVSESVQPGDSVILNCTIHTETCAGEHSVYWFRHGSGESRPGIIYTHGDKSDQCEKSPDVGSPTQRCVYNHPKRNLSLSDVGTYYCAVASCGEILFGNGTKLDIEDHRADPLLLVSCLGVVLCVTFTLIIVLVCIMYKMNNTTCVQCRGLVSQTRGPAVTRSDVGDQDGDSLHYVALNLSNKKNRSRRQRGHMETVVYAGIRQ